MRCLSLPVVVALLVVSACATGYHPAGLTGGFSEMRINERTWRVTFAGNGFTSRESAQRGALRRAADLTWRSGYYGFWIAGQDSSDNVSSHVTPVECTSSGQVQNSYYTGNTECTGGETRIVRRPSASITVNMVTDLEARQAPPYITVYDAVMILRQP